MKRLLRFALQLYPAEWRKRYGAELDALLGDMNVGARDLPDVIKAGVLLRLRSLSLPLSLASFSVAGMAIAALIATPPI